MTGAARLCVERHCEMRCERDTLQDTLRDAIKEMRQTLKLNTKDSIPGIATTRSIGLVKRQPAPSYGLGAAKPRGRELAAEIASLRLAEERQDMLQDRGYHIAPVMCSAAWKSTIEEWLGGWLPNKRDLQGIPANQSPYHRLDAKNVPVSEMADQ